MVTSIHGSAYCTVAPMNHEYMHMHISDAYMQINTPVQGFISVYAHSA